MADTTICLPEKEYKRLLNIEERHKELLRKIADKSETVIRLYDKENHNITVGYAISTKRVGYRRFNLHFAQVDNVGGYHHYRIQFLA